jgi:hypothetical protein
VEKFIVTKPWRRQRFTRGYNASKEEEEEEERKIRTSRRTKTKTSRTRRRRNGFFQSQELIYLLAYMNGGPDK